MKIKSIMIATVLAASICACNQSSTKDKESKPTVEAIISTSIPLERGPYQVNGASSWYALMSIGTPGQQMKFGMDTGNNGIWATSTQCDTKDCTQEGRVRFDPNTSSTFTWLDTSKDTLEFGPWGNMEVNNGEDFFSTEDKKLDSKTKFLLSIKYDGTQFEELNWDGGIGFPSQMPLPKTSFIVEQMINSGWMGASNAIISFYTNPETKKGEVLVGAVDSTKIDLSSKLVCPFVKFSDISPTGSALDYLWTTPLASFGVSGDTLAVDKAFCFDTGASDFKGDTSAVLGAKREIEKLMKTAIIPELTMTMGQKTDGSIGVLKLTPEQFVQEVQAGQDEGKKVLAFDNLPIEDLVLVGSVFLDYVYTVFVYEATLTGEQYELKPKEIVVYNKVNGPKIIQ